MELKVFTDGGSLNNPGQAAWAYVIYQGATVLEQHSEAMGIATNNDAEYTALVKALTRLKVLKSEGKLADLTKIAVISDSQLMVNQVNGLWKIKHGPIRTYIFEIRALENELAVPISYTHTLREGNTLADSLVKKALGR
jgi:ribonuclease HI